VVYPVAVILGGVLAAPAAGLILYGRVTDAHDNVLWVALALGAASSIASFSVAERTSRMALATATRWRQRVRALWPMHFGVLAVAGTMSLLVLLLVFAGNIH
jgi:hypothetical protein